MCLGVSKPLSSVVLSGQVNSFPALAGRRPNKPIAVNKPHYIARIVSNFQSPIIMAIFLMWR